MAVHELILLLCEIARDKWCSYWEHDPAMRVFEHCGACPAPCGVGTVTRSMRRVANATLLRFDRYNEPLDLRTETPDPITDI